MSKARAKRKKEEPKCAAVWKESVALNKYRCPECNRLLFRENVSEFTTNLNFYELNNRCYGSCVRGNPVVIVHEDYTGVQVSENWEEQLKHEHSDETTRLKNEISALKNERGMLREMVNNLNQLNDAKDGRMLELIAHENVLKDDINRLNDKLIRAELELNRVRAELVRERAGNHGEST